MNFGKMIDRVKLTLGMSETVSNDESALIKAWINEGVIDVISRTRPYTRVINLTVQPDAESTTWPPRSSRWWTSSFPATGSFAATRGRTSSTRRRRAARLRLRGAAVLVQPHRHEPTVIKAYGVFRPTT